MARSALITGITGQDGSYLAELLLDKGYSVHGMVRRASTETFARIEHLRDRVTLHQGDLLDQRSLVDALRAAEPDEIYNLAAMSFVQTSWVQPTLTADFTGVGVTRLLEAMREVCPEARFYQASSSEMFGKVQETPQTETTPFYPRSPYGVAKVYGHFITVNYRESYDLHATSGILFNHECLFSSAPVMVLDNGTMSVRSPADLMPLRRRGPSTQTHVPGGLMMVWDGEDWAKVEAITATRRRRMDTDHRPVSIEARGGVVAATAHHRMIDAAEATLPAGDVAAGDQLLLADHMPDPQDWTAVDPAMAELLGLLVADGSVARAARHADFASTDEGLRFRVAQLWSKAFLGRANLDPEASGGPLRLTGADSVWPWLCDQLYTPSGRPQVPPLILNAGPEARSAFLRGYGGGLSIKTDSPVLAQGLVYLYELEGSPAAVHAEHRDGRVCYQLNLRSAARVGGKGQHLAKSPAEVLRVVEVEPEDDEWVFDLATDSGRFCAGVGRVVVHNSPRRGLEFVTRKITWHAAAIALGQASELRLGNLDARRDWGYAKDYVEAMWLMLQQDDPQDFVIATGQMNTVRECVEIAFDQAGLSDRFDELVKLDERFLRPAEVDLLVGDPGKAERQLGWTPGTSFEQLIRLMVDADRELLTRQPAVSRGGAAPPP